MPPPLLWSIAQDAWLGKKSQKIEKLHWRNPVFCSDCGDDSFVQIDGTVFLLRYQVHYDIGYTEHLFNAGYYGSIF